MCVTDKLEKPHFRYSLSHPPSIGFQKIPPWRVKGREKGCESTCAFPLPGAKMGGWVRVSHRLTKLMEDKDLVWDSEQEASRHAHHSSGPGGRYHGQL